MVSIITGDIIHSRKAPNPESWMKPLKALLKTLGKAPAAWEIYRGDSFQLETTPAEALPVALQIKAIAKSVKNLDARMAIGIGSKSYDAPQITESTGEAFVFSGEAFESLKNETGTLCIKSPWQNFDEEINMMLKLALIITDSWSVTSAQTAQLVLRNPDMPQKELAEKLKIYQSSVSARYNRAYLREVIALTDYYRKRVGQQMKSV